MNRGWTAVVIAAGASLPGLLLALGVLNGSDPVRALVFGAAIVGAAFLLSWAAEVIQLDVSQGLALALVALIAILPEYAVDATFAWLAAEDPIYAGYAVANMTGANRLLIGIAWPMVIGLTFLRRRTRTVELEPSHGLEVVILLAATIYAFWLPIKGAITLLDTAVLAALFGIYLWRVAKQPATEPHLVGPASAIAALPAAPRRTVIGVMVVVAAAIILLVAKPFAQSLVNTGVALGLDQFLLVQWLAPLASEAPEFVVVGLFAWRGHSTPALGTLISSKMNQWTLLIGMLPLVYSLALGHAASLPLDERQRGEVLLTAAQSLFAVVLLLDLRLSLAAAGVLFGTFLVQMVLPETRGIMTAVYFALAAITLFMGRRGSRAAFGFVRT
jgi:cation:H+ antiporter